MAEYLELNYHNIKLTDAQLLFPLKTKMVNVKANNASSFRENMNCIFCEKEGIVKRGTQKHIMKCPVIRKEMNYPETIKYKIFKSDIIGYQLRLVKQFKINFNIKQSLGHKGRKNTN